VTALLARRVVGDGQGQRPEVGPELAPLVEAEQELADVVRPLGDDAQILVVDA
jgi:hypothetical protein